MLWSQGERVRCANAGPQGWSFQGVAFLGKALTSCVETGSRCGVWPHNVAAHRGIRSAVLPSNALKSLRSKAGSCGEVL